MKKGKKKVQKRGGNYFGFLWQLKNKTYACHHISLSLVLFLFLLFFFILLVCSRLLQELRAERGKRVRPKSKSHPDQVFREDISPSSPLGKKKAQRWVRLEFGESSSSFSFSRQFRDCDRGRKCIGDSAANGFALTPLQLLYRWKRRRRRSLGGASLLIEARGELLSRSLPFSLGSLSHSLAHFIPHSFALGGRKKKRRREREKGGRCSIRTREKERKLIFPFALLIPLLFPRSQNVRKCRPNRFFSLLLSFRPS
jgi:hypothetical protein